MEYLRNEHGYVFHTFSPYSCEDVEWMVVTMPWGNYEYRFFNTDTIYCKLIYENNMCREYCIRMPYGEWEVMFDNVTDNNIRILTLQRK